MKPKYYKTIYSCPYCGEEWSEEDIFPDDILQTEEKFCNKVCEEAYYAEEENGWYK